MPDLYRTLRSGAGAAVKVKGSRFLAEAFPAGSEDIIRCKIDAIRRREHAATHHCWAYRLGAAGHRFRYDDDGEPSGTAGPPILRRLDARALTNALVVVTRYYGGTKLGAGGLARAYGAAASEALEAATIVEKVVRVPLRLRFAYDDTTPARQALDRFDAVVQNETYTVETELLVAVRRSQVDAFVEAFTNALGGRGLVGKG